MSVSTEFTLSLYCKVDSARKLHLKYDELNSNHVLIKRSFLVSHSERVCGSAFLHCVPSMLCVPTERPAACLSHGSHSCQHVNLHDHQNSSSHSNIFISASDCYSSHWFLQAGQVSYCQGVILVRPPCHD